MLSETGVEMLSSPCGWKEEEEEEEAAGVHPKQLAKKPGRLSSDLTTARRAWELQASVGISKLSSPTWLTGDSFPCHTRVSSPERRAVPIKDL